MIQILFSASTLFFVPDNRPIPEAASALTKQSKANFVILASKACDVRTVEIRKKLIEEIKLSSNKNLLEEMYNFPNHDNEAENLYILSEAQKNAIAESREQIKNGQVFTDEQVNSEIEGWLRGK